MGGVYGHEGSRWVDTAGEEQAFFLVVADAKWCIQAKAEEVKDVTLQPFASPHLIGDDSSVLIT